MEDYTHDIATLNSLRLTTDPVIIDLAIKRILNKINDQIVFNDRILSLKYDVIELRLKYFDELDDPSLLEQIIMEELRTDLLLISDRDHIKQCNMRLKKILLDHGSVLES